MGGKRTVMASGLTPWTRHKLLRRRNWSRGFANLVFLLASNASKPALRKAGPPRHGIIEAAYPKMRRIRYQIRLNAMQRAVLSGYWRVSFVEQAAGHRQPGPADISTRMPNPSQHTRQGSTGEYLLCIYAPSFRKLQG